MVYYVEAQAGYRDAMCTTNYIFHTWTRTHLHYLNKNKKLFSAFIDFSEAFDCKVRVEL